MINCIPEFEESTKCIFLYFLKGLDSKDKSTEIFSKQQEKLLMTDYRLMSEKEFYSFMENMENAAFFDLKKKAQEAKNIENQAEGKNEKTERQVKLEKQETDMSKKINKNQTDQDVDTEDLQIQKVQAQLNDVEEDKKNYIQHTGYTEQYFPNQEDFVPSHSNRDYYMAQIQKTNFSNQNYAYSDYQQTNPPMYQTQQQQTQAPYFDSMMMNTTQTLPNNNFATGTQPMSQKQFQRPPKALQIEDYNEQNENSEGMYVFNPYQKDLKTMDKEALSRFQNEGKSNYIEYNRPTDEIYKTGGYYAIRKDEILAHNIGELGGLEPTLPKMEDIFKKHEYKHIQKNFVDPKLGYSYDKPPAISQNNQRGIGPILPPIGGSFSGNSYYQQSNQPPNPHNINPLCQMNYPLNSLANFNNFSKN